MTAMMTLPASKTMIQPNASIQSTLMNSLEGIDLAGRILEWQLKNDNLFPSLFDLIKNGEGMECLSVSSSMLPYLSFVILSSEWCQWSL